MIAAEIIKDSINNGGVRLTSWILTYPRYVHAEIMTHRMLSRNAASSRAIPFKKFLDTITENPAIPIWTKNQKGMQGADLEDWHSIPSTCEWLKARDKCIETAKLLNERGIHKANINRLLEPWFHITVLVTATEFENFFKLRAHADALPEFRQLAELMLEKYNDNFPSLLNDEQWHIPFEDKMPDVDLSTKLKIAVARCARLSYVNFDGEISVEKDVDLFNKLYSSGHFSPFEHCGMAYSDAMPDWCGNFRRGWVQYRKLLANENQSDNRVLKK